PIWSGNAVLIFQTQQLGIITLLPSPKRPCCHSTNWRYAACLYCCCSTPGSCLSSIANTSFHAAHASRKTPGSRTYNCICAMLLTEFSGAWRQQSLSWSVVISLQLLQVRQCKGQICKTPGSRTYNCICAMLLTEFSGAWRQQSLSWSVVISLQSLQVHQCKGLYLRRARCQTSGLV